ncbi:MAG TPA: NAD(P)/FAD-dependent oxidoreductase [Streptosporangiaceae bacterium]|nr:NAD(P)/FAD-dependent oxidoreductase [Streptosporangiaceae bacterium]
MGEPEHTDVVVIGMGPGGEYAAGALAEAGLHVTGVEERLVGGECPYFGCIPSKMMIRAGNLIAETRRVPGMAGTSTVTPDWSPVALRIREEATDYWDDKVAADRFESKGGHLVRGRGTITGPGEVTVSVSGVSGASGASGGDRVFRARRGIVINSGTAPAIPPVQGLAGTPYWTNREIVQTEHVPASMIVLGGGAIGAELAQVFSRFGTEVTVVEALPRLVSFEEPEASDLIERIFMREGIKVCTSAPAERIGHNDACFRVHLGMSVLTAEQLLVATGRRTDLAGLGVAAIGLDPSARVIATDGWMRAAEGVWAIGDVTGKGAFTHMSMYQADIAVRDILGQGGQAADYRAVPRVTFTDPEIGSVGLTEAQARKAGLRVRTGLTQVPYSARGWIHKAGNDGFIKVVADADRSVLVGATSAGPWGGEVLSALQVAIRAEVPLATLRNMPYAYPTFYRAIEDALRSLEGSS